MPGEGQGLVLHGADCTRMLSIRQPVQQQRCPEAPFICSLTKPG